MSLLLGDASAVLICCLFAAVVVLGVLAVGFGAFDSRFDMPSTRAMDPQLDAAFERGAAGTDAVVDLMPNLPSWIARAMRAKDANNALFEHARLVCGTQRHGPGAETLTCNRTINLIGGSSTCQMTYSIEASFDYDRLFAMKGRRLRFCS